LSGAAGGLLALAAGVAAGSAAAQEHEPAGTHLEGHATTQAHVGEGHAAEGHAAEGHAAEGHAAESHAAEGHGGGHEGGEHHQEFNWFYGMLGEKADVEPSVLWRAPGTPAPFGAQLINTALLIGLLVRFGRKPLAQGLADRRQRILRGIEDASAMQAEATEQLRVYRAKLDNLDAEIERVRREMREGAEAERKRVLEDAKSRRARLEQEARTLIDRELEALREQLTRETAVAAVESARALLKDTVSTDDHRRLCEEYLQALAPAMGSAAELQRPGEPGRPSLLPGGVPGGVPGSGVPRSEVS
jgi:F-type H+-transporting ATPase subunit b